VQPILDATGPRMDKAVDHLREGLQGIRTGRASTSLVDSLTVEQYGQTMSIKAVATLSAPDAHTIMIAPWDKSMIPVIEKVIRETQSLGLNPGNDGNAIRLNIPPMTTERRQQLVKQVGEQIEACHVTIRNVRHDVLDEVRKLEKSGGASQDDVKYAEAELNKKIEAYRLKLEEIRRAKVAEITEV